MIRYDIGDHTETTETIQRYFTTWIRDGVILLSLGFLRQLGHHDLSIFVNLILLGTNIITTMKLIPIIVVLYQFVSIDYTRFSRAVSICTGGHSL